MLPMLVLELGIQLEQLNFALKTTTRSSAHEGHLREEKHACRYGCMHIGMGSVSAPRRCMGSIVPRRYGGVVGF
jgi:hypothetical protein